LKVFPQTLAEPILNFTIWWRGPGGLRHCLAMVLPRDGHVTRLAQRAQAVNVQNLSAVPCFSIDNCLKMADAAEE
jgi:hypothetical protein